MFNERGHAFGDVTIMTLEQMGTGKVLPTGIFRRVLDP